METYRGALSQLVSSHHLDIEVFGLRLASRLDEPLQHLKANKDRIMDVLFWTPEALSVYVGFILYRKYRKTEGRESRPLYSGGK